MQATAEKSVYLLENVTTTTTGHAERSRSIKKTFHAIGGTDSGTGSATIVVQVSNVNPTNENDWLTAGTITLALNSSGVSDGFIVNAGWIWVRAKVTSISGTGATVSLVMGL